MDELKRLLTPTDQDKREALRFVISIVFLAVLALLAGCSSAPAVTPGAVCPPPVEYSKDVLRQAAGELRTLPSGAALETMMIDYGRERDMLRACREAAR